jgi:hypothetical protein
MYSKQNKVKNIRHRYHKTQKKVFDAEFESVEKVTKKVQSEKVIDQKLLHMIYFATFSTDSKSASNSVLSYTHIYF